MFNQIQTANEVYPAMYNARYLNISKFTFHLHSSECNWN